MAPADDATVPTQHGKTYSATPTWALICVVVLLLAAALLPSLINIGRYQHRIAQIISTSVGRPVHMSAVKLRLLPRPGFELSDFVVDEDAAFGAEPMLRSPSVVASVRLLSMWRGRLEIASINFDEPSLNLVRRKDGQWNFGAVLLKASSTPNAPTAQRHLSAAPRFPYIEASNARINFKAGDEKQPFSFVNADLSVWLDNPEEWRLRFEAQPVRTDLDLDLADTGTLKISGSVKRAAALNEVPLRLHGEWIKAPLGQLSRILAGRDAGWRGDLEMRADITGTGQDALLKTQLKATNVHRIEFAPAEAMDLDANCQARYTRPTHSLEAVACTSPIGNGHLLLRGAIREMQQRPTAAFDLEMQKVPVSAVLGLARSVREGFAPNLKAVGSIDGGFQYSDQATGRASLQGQAAVVGLQLNAALLGRPLLLPSLQLIAAGESEPRDQPGKRNLRSLHKKRTPEESAQLQETALLLSPFELPAGGSLPLMVEGRFTSHGYQMHFAGDANIKSVIAYSRALGLLKDTVSPLAPLGSAELDLRASGAWLTPVVDSDPLVATQSTDGRLQLRNARIATDYLAAPLDIVLAQAVFKGTDVSWDSAAVNYGKLHAEGSLQYSQLCSANPDCVATFRLKFPAIDAAAAQSALLGGDSRAEFIEELLARLDRRAHPWPALSGTLEAATLTLDQMALRDAKATVRIKGNQVVIESFDARTLGGGLHLTGTVDASGPQPDYALEAAFTRVNATDVAAIFHERWGSGQISGATRLRLTGYKFEDLATSAAGTFHWDWTQGGLPIGPPGQDDTELTQFQRWNAEGTIAAGKLSLSNGNVIPARGSGSAPESVRGTISFGRELNLVLAKATGLPEKTPGASGREPAESAAVPSTAVASVSGTLAEPRVRITAPATAKAEKIASQASVQ